MALLDLQGMTSENGGGHNSSLSVLCGHSSNSQTLCL
ncbi:hypothetical protein BZB76_6195 [Actinomadura pelletieri DSM 43383]|uniref:SapB/AmfS family lantipeptide n=1 Tax=Actinomadura pelletieri DSM 43383 TaxID=1120940 RepID=A0A495QC22_9ACTN|nr:SapB/AmfS family lanthipeptide [Actinomadura pelletieri]RKS69056.1 hypothetical protein BZB76_6195 [Actinomadura pelletieri DSM 43383]